MSDPGQQWQIIQGDARERFCPKCGHKLDLQIQRAAWEIRDDKTLRLLGWSFKCEHCGAELVQTVEMRC